MFKLLPATPSLEQLKNQAKELLKAHQNQDLQAARRIQEHLPRLAQTALPDILSSKLALTDAQLVIAREYGFTSWPRLKRHIESLTPLSDDIIEQFKNAIHAGDVSKVKSLFKRYPLLTSKINDPLFAFGSRSLNAARHNRAMVDLLLKHGADINARSDWWAGSFGILDGADVETAAYLIKRGAVIDIHAAAALGMVERVQELVQENPELVNAKGGDGQRPLHVATRPEIIDFLLANGADINARDIDHNATPAQYAINDPVKCRYLVERGAEIDIFIACVLGDVAIAQAALESDPNCLNARIGEGQFTAPGEHIYTYNIGYTARPLDLAAQHGHTELIEFLLQRSSPRQKFLFACMQADESTVQSLLSQQPDLMRSLRPDEMSLICDAAWRNNTAAVRVMLKAGFDINAQGVNNSTPLDRAALWGYLDTVNLLLEHNASLTVVNDFGGTPLGACIYGSLHFINEQSNHAACVESMLRAGAPVPEAAGGSAAVMEVLRRYGAKG
ncbi:MAG: ankyrin repeat domain-containing protein [Abitibacteriaceae bacterium]|nr:ankyrin repeat domain-containing protein [Abditibacteriaceae bacterium]MBV9867296.1 ankyrin repeat domain-containing protein [Abditibacteriaceae bacterium]